MATIGTAGHVDHGKSALVEALTGMHPDRLAEEKARGMTIDLGFAWLALPDGRTVSVVDVPGHEDFIANMLAGAGGIDLALLVIAADEGVMPQTREHLAILDLLRVPRTVVALTKCDLAEDEWLELVQSDIREILAPTVARDAPIVPVSARTGAHLEHLRAVIAATLPHEIPRPHDLPPRLPVDRVFSMAGFGTVVTGTLIEGEIHTGHEVLLVPGDRRARVRGIQIHRQAATSATAGQRVALNLSGVERSDVLRGMVVSQAGALHITERMDAWVESWPGAPRGIAHNAEVLIHAGTAAVPARIIVMASDEIAPGQSGWAQVRLARPLAMARGDRFIVRNPSPGETLGGGRVADPSARLYRRSKVSLARLGDLASEDPLRVLPAFLDRRELAADELARVAHLSFATTRISLAALVADGAIVDLAGRVLAADRWRERVAAARDALGEYHRRFPLRLGMPREEWRSHLHLDAAQAGATFARMHAEGLIAAPSPRLVALPDYAPRFSPEHEAGRQAVLVRLHEAGLNPPPLVDLVAAIGDEMLAALIDSGAIVRLNADVALDATIFAAARDAILRFLAEHDRVTAAEARDVLATTRRVAVPLLETLDALRLTRRLGDAHVRMLGRS